LGNHPLVSKNARVRGEYHRDVTLTDRSIKKPAPHNKSEAAGDIR